MEGQGDGSHNGRDRPNIPLRNFPRGGNWPPADQLHAGLAAWLDFILNHEAFDGDAPFMIEEWIEQPANVQNADNNDNEDANNVDNENHGNVDNDDVYNANVDNDNGNNNENVEDAGVVDRVGVDQGVEDDPLPGPSRRMSREQEQDDVEARNRQQLRLWDDSSDSDSDNTDYTGKSLVVHAGASTRVVEENHPLSGPSRKRPREEDGLDIEEKSRKQLRFSEEFDCTTVRDTDCDENVGKSPAKHAGSSAEVAEDNPLPGPSRGSSSEADGQIVKGRTFKNIRWWDEFDVSDSDTDNDDANCDYNNTGKNLRNSPVEHAGASGEVVEDDPLPGPSRKRSREEDGQDVEEGSRKRVRLCEDFDCTSDRDVDKTDCDNNTDKNIGNSPAETAGPSAEENPLPGRKRTRKRDRVEDQQPGVSRKRSREDDEGEDSTGKRFKH